MGLPLVGRQAGGCGVHDSGSVMSAGGCARWQKGSWSVALPGRCPACVGVVGRAHLCGERCWGLSGGVSGYRLVRVRGLRCSSPQSLASRARSRRAMVIVSHHVLPLRTLRTVWWLKPASSAIWRVLRPLSALWSRREIARASSASGGLLWRRWPVGHCAPSAR